MAKSFLVSPGRAYLVIAGEGTKIVRTNGTLIDTVPEGANNVSITVDTHEIIVMDNAAKIQQLYNGNAGSSGIMTAAEGEDAGSWKVEIVNTLPEQGSVGIIYMLRTNRSGTDRYDDYIWIPEDNAYELLGRRPESTSVDLSNVAKTDVANTFTKSQQINGTLTATSIDATRLSCEQQADIGTADVSYLNYDTANGSYMTVSHVTILTSLHVDPQAAVDLPGLEWCNKSDGGRYILASYDVSLNTLTADTAHVSSMLTLGTGNIELDGYHDTIKVQGTDASIAVDPSRMQILASDARLVLTGSEIIMNVGPDSPDSRNVFSVTQDTAGKFILNVSDGATLGGSVSIPDTLTVHNLNVTGTVTGITTGGGDTPTIDFSNGVTIMETLTADDVIADTVTASTLSAGSSLSVSSESVIYRHSDGAIYIHGDIVNATQVAATTFIPTNIQGATFTGPLVMSKDNSLLVWNQGNMAEIRNGNITGFYYAQVDHCTVTHALSADSAKINRASVTDTLVVKDLVVTGTATGLPESGGGGSVEIPDPLSVTNLSANAAAFGAVTVTNTLTAPSGVYFASSLAFRKKGDLQKVQLENPNNKNDNIVLGVHRVECTAMEVTDLTIHGNITGLGANVHATEVWCFKLGSDHENKDNPIELLSPLEGKDMLLSNSLRILPDEINVPIYSGTNISGCIVLGMDGYHSYPMASFAVGKFTVDTNHKDGVSSPILAILNESVRTDINGLSTSIQKFKVAIAPVYETADNPTASVNLWQSSMLELTGDNAWKLGGTSQFALTARVNTLKIASPYDTAEGPGSTPLITIDVNSQYPSSSMISLVGTLAHHAGGSIDHTAYYADPFAAYYCGFGHYSKSNPALYINPNRQLITEVRALYSYHTNTETIPAGKSTLIPGMYARNMLCATALKAGIGETFALGPGQLGVNAWGTYIQKPIKALDSASDVTGLYYKPTAGTILPNLWQELVTSAGRPLSSVSEYTLDDSIFGLLANTAQHPASTNGFPDDKSIWESEEPRYDICVSSVEFGFSTGANGLTLTWPSQVIWPDEPDRLPPTQFLPNMCYRFVARMEPIPDPNADMFDRGSGGGITYKWVILVSQTYSYPNPWATT